jgi:CRP-like cAMP-binding protein
MLPVMDADQLTKLRRLYHFKLMETEAARQVLADAIREAAAEGWRQVDIVMATGYTREQIRRIVAGRTR